MNTVIAVLHGACAVFIVGPWAILPMTAMRAIRAGAVPFLFLHGSDLLPSSVNQAVGIDRVVQHCRFPKMTALTVQIHLYCDCAFAGGTFSGKFYDQSVPSPLLDDKMPQMGW